MRSLSRAILDSGRELDDGMNGGDSTFKSARTATGLSFEIEYTEFSIALGVRQRRKCYFWHMGH